MQREAFGSPGAGLHPPPPSLPKIRLAQVGFSNDITLKTLTHPTTATHQHYTHTLNFLGFY